MADVNVIEEHGLVVDIDDTLCETSLVCVEMMLEKFHVESEVFVERTPRDILKIHGYPAIIPTWLADECQAYLRTLLSSDDFLRKLPVVEQARATLVEIAKRVPVSMYLTSRLEAHADVTREWVKRHGFPTAPVICRHTEVRDRDWKVRFLTRRYPNTLAYIDNELFVPDPLEYKGKLIEIIRHKKTSPRNAKALVCYSWKEVSKAISRLQQT